MQATDGAIGYVAVSYIAADSLDEALLQNAAGNYPEPTTKGITAAADAVTTIQPDGSVPLVNPPASAPDAYPMSTYSYAIVPQTSPKAKQLKAFLTYAIGPTARRSARPRLPAAAGCGCSARKTVIAKITTLTLNIPWRRSPPGRCRRSRVSLHMMTAEPRSLQHPSAHPRPAAVRRDRPARH